MYLLDINVISELQKIHTPKINPQVIQWLDSVDASHLYLSVITVQELEIGILRLARRDASQAARLRGWLNETVLPIFSGRILPVDFAVAQRGASLHIPDPRPFADALIAATALVHNMSVVTRNVLNFKSMGVPLINPWG
jgi:predicted nucleic acid-binding protein